MPCAAGFFVRCALYKRLRRLSALRSAHPEKYPPGTESPDKGAQGRSAQGVPVRWCQSAGIPETACLFRLATSEPSRSFPPFAQHALQARRGAFALLRYPLPHGAGRAVPQACSVRRTAGEKTKGQTFPPARGVFHGGNQSPSGRARSCRSFSCASACTSSGKSLSTLFARNRYCHRSSCRASLTTAS